MILSYDSYKETVYKENEMKDALTALSDQVMLLMKDIENIKKVKTE